MSREKDFFAPAQKLGRKQLAKLVGGKKDGPNPGTVFTGNCISGGSSFSASCTSSVNMQAQTATWTCSCAQNGVVFTTQSKTIAL